MSKPLFKLLVALLIGVTQANCIPNRDVVSFSSGTGNGSGYEGKPEEGTYYHTEEGYTCETEEGEIIKSYKDAIQIVDTSDGNFEAFLLGDTCSDSRIPINTEDLTYSPFSPNIIMYEGRIFESYPEPPLNMLLKTTAYCFTAPNSNYLLEFEADYEAGINHSILINSLDENSIFLKNNWLGIPLNGYIEGPVSVGQMPHPEYEIMFEYHINGQYDTNRVQFQMHKTEMWPSTSFYKGFLLAIIDGERIEADLYCAHNK